MHHAIEALKKAAESTPSLRFQVEPKGEKSQVVIWQEGVEIHRLAIIVELPSGKLVMKFKNHEEKNCSLGLYPLSSNEIAQVAVAVTSGTFPF